MTRRELLELSRTELQAQVDRHHELIRNAFEEEAVDKHCVWSECRHQRALVEVLLESMKVLDETRKAFKSKQLEQLRGRLMSVLADYATSNCVVRISTPNA